MVKFSIIIPVYNAERYLAKSIGSVLSQTYSNWEMICIDDGSTDSSAKVVSEYASKDQRILLLQQRNSGPGIARNMGIERATGDYVVFLDSDDYLSENYLELLSYHTEDVVFIDVQRVDDSGQVLGKEPMGIYKEKNKEDILRWQMTGKILWGGVRKAVRLDVLKFNNITYSNHQIGEEAIYSFKVLFFAKTVGFIDQVVYNYVQHNDSQSHVKSEDPWGDVAENMRDCIKKMGVYERYADSLNAFLITASAATANRLSAYRGFLKYKELIKVRMEKLHKQLDYQYPIDYESMPSKARVVYNLLQKRLYMTVWLLGKFNGIKHKLNK